MEYTQHETNQPVIDSDIIHILFNAIQHDDVNSFKYTIDKYNINIPTLCHTKFTYIYNDNHPEYIINFALRNYADNILKWLLYDLNNNIQLDTCIDDDGNTPLMTAITMLAHGDKDMDFILTNIIENFCNHNSCNVNHINYQHKTPLWLLLENEELQLSDEDIMTVYITVIDYLLTSGANILYTIPLNTFNNISYSDTADIHSSLIHVASQKHMISYNFSYFLHSVKQCINSNNEFITFLQQRDYYGNSPLKYALQSDTLEKPLYLLFIGCRLTNSEPLTNPLLNASDYSTTIYNIMQLPIDDPIIILLKYIIDLPLYVETMDLYDTNLLVNENILDSINLKYVLDMVFKHNIFLLYMKANKVDYIIEQLPANEKLYYVRKHYYMLQVLATCCNDNGELITYINYNQTINNRMNDIYKTHECCICYTNYVNGNLVVLDCPGNHYTCFDCINNWTSNHNSCPMCRHEF